MRGSPKGAKEREQGRPGDPQAIPARYLRRTTVDNVIETCIYQLEARHKTYAQPLNVVIIVKRNLKTHAHAHVILFSSDLTLPFDQLIDYYGLRFQLEFNFRDAKQYWGLEDFMNTRSPAVTNAANLALFMVNVAERLRQARRHWSPAHSGLDLKTAYRGAKYGAETIKAIQINIVAGSIGGCDPGTCYAEVQATDVQVMVNN